MSNSLQYDKHFQENHCLKAKLLVDLLRTTLFEIEDFHDFSSWDSRLKKLKSQLNDIYWKL